MQTATLPNSCNRRDRLKPRRGWPVYSQQTPPKLFFLFFGGAAFVMTMPAWKLSAQLTLRAQRVIAPRRRKTKRKAMIGVLPYKQATPTGFGAPADRNNPYIIP